MVDDCRAGTDLNSVFRFVLFCFSFCFVFGGPGGGFGGPGGGFLGSSKSSGKATTETIKKKATTRTTKTTTKTSPGLATLPLTTLMLNADTLQILLEAPQILPLWIVSGLTPDF